MELFGFFLLFGRVTEALKLQLESNLQPQDMLPSSSSASRPAPSPPPHSASPAAAREKEPSWARGEWSSEARAKESEAKELAEFLEDVDSYTPTVPEAIIQQYLQLGGTSCKDPRM